MSPAPRLVAPRLVAPRLVTGCFVGLLLASTAGVSFAQPLRAKPAPEPPPADSVLTGVEVTAPKTISRERYGVIEQKVEMSVRVPYGDLDMASPAGLAELDRRVKQAADYVCDELVAMYPMGTPDDFYCAKQAVRDAQPQVIQARNAG